jgi:hypothetical protein
MGGEGPDWATAVRPWQAASIALGALEALAVVAALALSVSRPTAALGVSGVVVALALARWMLEGVALRYLPPVDFDSLYADSALDQGQRVILAATLVSPLILIPLLFTISPSVAVVGLVVYAVAAAPRLFRAWRRNSWLAMSRLPVSPRRRPQQTG